MRCPTLSEFPPPPPGKAGWPWTEESPQLPDTISDSHPWPKISIVTPSYNQGQFIEETILSVKNQDYPNIEHIIVDGGSTDRTLEILKKYEGTYKIYWISEPDEGQADAVNKGFALAKGEIIGWLNSDDVYFDTHVITRVVQCFNRRKNFDIIYGNLALINKTGLILKIDVAPGFTRSRLLRGAFIPQPATFSEGMSSRNTASRKTFITSWTTSFVYVSPPSTSIITAGPFWLQGGIIRSGKRWRREKKCPKSLSISYECMVKLLGPSIDS